MNSTNNGLQLRQCFINGLKGDHNLTYEDILSWKYCGGDNGGHYNYWRLVFGKRNLPRHLQHCVWNREIVKNCYIWDGRDAETIIVVGYCCIKRFLEHSTRTCEICDEPHKNRTVNRCNECKVKNYCSYYKECNNIVPKHKKQTTPPTCFDCRKKDPNYGKCIECKRECNPDFEKCRECQRKETDPDYGRCLDCKKACNPKFQRSSTCYNKCTYGYEELDAWPRRTVKPFCFLILQHNLFYILM